MKFSEIQLQIDKNPTSFNEILFAVNSFDELCKLYGTYSNGSSHNLFKDLIKKYNFSNSHWKIIPINKKWKVIEKICPICKTKFTTKVGCGDEKAVCSRTCSNTFFSNIRHTEKSKEKLRITLKTLYDICGRKPPIEIVCVVCGTKVIAQRKTQKMLFK